MRIAIVTSLLVGVQREGLGGYLHNLLRELKNIDDRNEYWIFMPRFHKEVFDLHKRLRIVTSPNWTNRPFWNILWCLFVLPVLLKFYRIDLVHLPDYRRVLLFKPCRVVTSVLDLINWKVPGRISGLRKWYYRLIRQRILRQADLFITISHNSQRDMVDMGFSPSRIRMIYLGVAEEFRPCPREKAIELLRPYQLPSSFILCVSRLEHPQKNHVTLLRAFKRLCQDGGFKHSLVLVGKRWWGSDYVFSEIQRLNLEERVHFCNYVSQEDLPYFYNASDLCVYPSLYEGFGLPLLEAMASGTPVVAARSSSIEEIGSCAALLFPPREDQALAECIGLAMKDENLRKKLVLAGLELAAQFSWRDCTRRHVQVYKELLSPSRIPNSIREDVPCLR